MDERSKIEEWIADGRDLFLRRLFDLVEMGTAEEILAIIDDVCHECWNSDRPCQCANDD